MLLKLRFSVPVGHFTPRKVWFPGSELNTSDRIPFLHFSSAVQWIFRIPCPASGCCELINTSSAALCSARHILSKLRFADSVGFLPTLPLLLLYGQSSLAYVAFANTLFFFLPSGLALPLWLGCIIFLYPQAALVRTLVARPSVCLFPSLGGRLAFRFFWPAPFLFFGPAWSSSLVPSPLWSSRSWAPRWPPLLWSVFGPRGGLPVTSPRLWPFSPFWRCSCSPLSSSGAQLAPCSGFSSCPFT
jgi:hypothetical protein